MAVGGKLLTNFARGVVSVMAQNNYRRKSVGREDPRLARRNTSSEQKSLYDNLDISPKDKARKDPRLGENNWSENYNQSMQTTYQHLGMYDVSNKYTNLFCTRCTGNVS